MAPVFSIGIPTFNRCHFLRESLAAATQQSLPGIEVIVSDDASNDETKELVEGCKSHVVYHRNEKNIGSVANFRKVFELSHGSLFSWLQDDDLIHEDFARRASEAFQRFPNLKAYLTFAFATGLPNCLLGAWTYGPPCGGHWMRKDGLQKIPGTVVPPLSLFVTVGYAPTAAFERRALALAVEYLKSEYWLLMERVVLAKAVADGDVAIDPYIGGVYRLHPGQTSVACHDQALLRSQWRLMAADLAEIAGGMAGSWKTDFEAILPEIAINHRLSWAVKTLDWPKENAFCQEVKACLLASLPESLRSEVQGNAASKLKRVVRLLTPPIFWDGLKVVKSRIQASWTSPCL